MAALCQAVETKDLYTRGHRERVSRGAVMIGREIGMRASRVEAILYAARPWLGSCTGLAPDFPNNCSGVFKLPSGDIIAPFVTAPGPGAKPIALTGGTGTYRNIGGDWTPVEFGNGRGRLTLHLLSLVARG